MLNQCEGVLESNVYGVEVPGTEGRAGMVALVVDDGFDVAALSKHVEKSLPRFARPCFVRLQRQLAVTGSFKYVKTHLQKEGFDPEKVEEPLYFLDPQSQRYCELDPATFERIRASALSL